MQLLAELEPEMIDRLHVDVLPWKRHGGWAAAPAAQGVRQTLFCGQESLVPARTNIAVEPDGAWFSAVRTVPRTPACPGRLLLRLHPPTMSAQRIDPARFQRAAPCPRPS